MYRLVAAIVLTPLWSGAVFAADWQYTGNSAIGKEATAMFFDADSVEHPNKGTVRVWVKAISQKALNRYYEKHGSEKWYIENVAQGCDWLHPAVLHASGNQEALFQIQTKRPETE